MPSSAAADLTEIQVYEGLQRQILTISNLICPPDHPKSTVEVVSYAKKEGDRLVHGVTLMTVAGGPKTGGKTVSPFYTTETFDNVNDAMKDLLENLRLQMGRAVDIGREQEALQNAFLE